MELEVIIMMSKTSEQLAEFISFLRSNTQDYQHYNNLLLEAEKKLTDLNHALELDKNGYRARCKIGTQLRRCLLERRAAKDCVEELAPLADFMTQNKGLLDKLSHVLGETRKAERYHANRSYRPRISSATVAGDKSVVNTKAYVKEIK